MEDRKKILRNQKGFTLIEIIAVLVILGILAAVAIPKYMDIQNEARIKSANSAISEMRARCSNQYAKILMNQNGTPPTVAQILAGGTFNGVTVDALSNDLGPDYTVTAVADGTTGINITVSQVQGQNVTVPVSRWVLPI